MVPPTDGTTQNHAAAFTEGLYLVPLVNSLAIGLACAILITLDRLRRRVFDQLPGGLPC
jgi:hypothetical protein